MQPENTDPISNPDEQTLPQQTNTEPVSAPNTTGAQSEVANPPLSVRRPMVIQPLTNSADLLQQQSDTTPPVETTPVEQATFTPATETTIPPIAPAETAPSAFDASSLESEPTPNVTTTTPPAFDASLAEAAMNAPQGATTESPSAQQIIMSPQSIAHAEFTEAPQAKEINPDDLFGKKAKKKKIFIFSGLVALFLVILSTGYTFAFYLPNTPENVWKTGLSRTGKEVEAIAEKISDPESFSAMSKNKVTVSGKITTEELDSTVNFSSNFDETKSDNNLDVGINSDQLAEPININAKIKTNLPENSIWPNVFFSISGFSSLGLDGFLPGLNNYEGKWISVEQDFYEKYLSEATSSGEVGNITEEDIISVMNDAVEVSQEYIFSTDPEKAVINKDEFIGKEESEGITAFRYKASINEANAAKFCVALVDKLYANESFKKINNSEEAELQKSIEDAKKNCEVDEKKTEEVPESFDVWIDKKFKILHKIRFTEDLEAEAQKAKDKKAECVKDNAVYDYEGDSAGYCDYYDDYIKLIETGEKYSEVGQIYNGEDTFTLFTNQINNTNKQKNSIRGDVSINSNDLSINGNFKYEDNSENSKGSAEVSIKTEPFEGEVDAAKPEGAIPLQQVIDDLMNQSQYSQQLGVNTEDGENDNNEPGFNLFERLKNYLEMLN